MLQLPVLLSKRFRNLRSSKGQALNIIRCEPSFGPWWSVTILPKLKSPEVPRQFRCGNEQYQVTSAWPLNCQLRNIQGSTATNRATPVSTHELCNLSLTDHHTICVIQSELLTATSDKIPINKMNAILTPHDSWYSGMTLVRQVTWK